MKNIKITFRCQHIEANTTPQCDEHCDECEATSIRYAVAFVQLLFQRWENAMNPHFEWANISMSTQNAVANICANISMPTHFEWRSPQDAVSMFAHQNHIFSNAVSISKPHLHAVSISKPLCQQHKAANTRHSISKPHYQQFQYRSQHIDASCYVTTYVAIAFFVVMSQQRCRIIASISRCCYVKPAAEWWGQQADDIAF